MHSSFAKPRQHFPWNLTSQMTDLFPRHLVATNYPTAPCRFHIIFINFFSNNENMFLDTLIISLPTQMYLPNHPPTELYVFGYGLGSLYIAYVHRDAYIKPLFYTLIYDQQRDSKLSALSLVRPHHTHTHIHFNNIRTHNLRTHKHTVELVIQFAQTRYMRWWWWWWRRAMGWLAGWLGWVG